MNGQTTTRIAAAILIVLGAGHLLLTGWALRGSIAGWWERGLWAAVPLRFGTPEGSPGEAAEGLRNAVGFWAGAGSFAVPLILVGLLIWGTAGRGGAVPAWAGWTIAVWCTVCGIVLEPSPFFVGSAAGLLLVLAGWFRRRAAAPAVAAPVVEGASPRPDGEPAPQNHGAGRTR